MFALCKDEHVAEACVGFVRQMCSFLPCRLMIRGVMCICMVSFFIVSKGALAA